MAMRTPFRTSRILRAARTRPSRLPARQPFAAVHTTAARQTEADPSSSSDATNPATTQEPETSTPPTEAKTTTSPPSVAELARSIRTFVAESAALAEAIERQYVRYLKPYHITDIGGQSLTVRRLDRRYGPNGLTRVLEATYLRDRCPCPLCVSPSSGNKSFSTGEIDPRTMFASVREDHADGSVHIRWDRDIPRISAAAGPGGHVSVFPGSGPGSIAAIAAEPSAPFAAIENYRPKFPVWTTYWTRKQFRLRRLPFDEFMAGPGDSEAFDFGLAELHQTGLLLLTGVPQTETAVADIALRFGAIKETFYGRLFDVVSKPEAENVAYTSAYLGLHSDMLYLESPPRIQLLHCLENTCSGGESLFADAPSVARELQKNDPAAYRALKGTEVPYHYSRNGFTYRRARPVIEEGDTWGTLKVWWSPPFQAPMPVPANVKPGKDNPWLNWQAAAHAFRKRLEHKDNLFEHKLSPGECVLFDNRRVLHGRRAFDAGSGRRWLKGTYVADEDFESTFSRVRENFVITAEADGSTPGKRFKKLKRKFWSAS